MRIVQRLSKQAEKVGKRRGIYVRPEKTLYKKLEKESKRRKVSMNIVSLEILEKGAELLA